jgi:hypothetical protein
MKEVTLDAIDVVRTHTLGKASVAGSTATKSAWSVQRLLRIYDVLRECAVTEDHFVDKAILTNSHAYPFSSVRE